MQAAKLSAIDSTSTNNQKNKKSIVKNLLEL